MITGARIGVALAAVLLATLGVGAVAGGADERRGGNHDCDSGDGSFYSSHFYPAGDNITVGFRTDSIDFPPSTQDQVRVQNFEEGTNNRTSLNCGGDEGTWKLFVSRLGPGDDSVRLDAKRLESYGSSELPRSIEAVLKGGGGDDVLRGHRGPDRFSGGGGNDTIKADDGRRDVVKCGPGKDKADVDKRDQVKGCEKLT